MRLYSSLYQLGRAVQLRPMKTKLHKYAVFQPTPLSLESMIEFGECALSSWIFDELFNIVVLLYGYTTGVYI